MSIAPLSGPMNVVKPQQIKPLKENSHLLPHNPNSSKNPKLTIQNSITLQNTTPKHLAIFLGPNVDDEKSTPPSISNGPILDDELSTPPS